MNLDRIHSALDRTLDLWRAESSPWRERLAREHGGFSREVVDCGTREALRDWIGPALSRLREHESLGAVRAPRLTAVWLAGSIPSSAFSAVLLPLLIGSDVSVKLSSADPLSARLFAESLGEVDAEVGAKLRFDARPEILKRAEAVVVHGRDETVAALRAQVPDSTPFLGYGHKLSIAAIGPEADLERAARDLALDVALYDGRGCLSPAYVLVQGKASEFAAALAAELQRLETELPRGWISHSEQAAIHDLRARAAIRDDVELFASAGSTAWAVHLESAGARPPAGALRQVPVVPVEGPDALADWCTELAPHLSSIGEVGWGERRVALTQALKEGGGSRLCPLGRMQFPAIGWHHDGLPPLRPLMREADGS